MTKKNEESGCSVYYEYFGNTQVKKIKVYSRNRIVKKWIMFDSAEDALDYFNTECGD
jgi:hypothetical protein